MSSPSRPPVKDGKQQHEVIAPASFEPMADGVLSEKKTFSPAMLILGFLLILAAIALYFLISARSVLITTQVSDAAIDVSGGFHIDLGNRVLLLPGTYEVAIEHPQYQTLIAELNISAEAQQAVEFQLRRKPDIYSLETNPEGAVVLIDGVKVGSTPLLEVAVEEGEHQLSFQHPRYIVVEQSLEVAGGGNKRNIAVQLQPAWAQLTLDSVPQGADVFSGDTLLGQTPIVAEVIQGQRLISVRRSGFKSFDQEIEVAAGVDQTLPTVSLQPADATLALSSKPADAGVLLNGTYSGQTPVSLELAANTDYSIELFKQGYKKKKQTVRYESGDKQSLEVSLASERGEVHLQLRTSDVVVSVNGKKIDAKSAVLSLPSVPQTIRVSRAGYQTYEKTITPRPGFKQSLDVTLYTPEQSRSASIKSVLKTSAGQAMRLLKPGPITLGASRRESGRRANENMRKVVLKRPFYLSVHEVTNVEFRAFDAGHSSKRVEDKSLNGDRQPVVRVSWNKAALYCNWLSEKDGLRSVYEFKEGVYVGADQKANGYRLPTEAEWAWAARKLEDQTLKYAWGQDWPVPAGAGNFAGDSAGYIVGRTLPNYDDGYAASSPVGRFRMNQYEIYDLAGNVAEWIHDFYTPGKPAGEQVDPFGPPETNYHVVRGSSWRHGSQVELRLSYRDYADRERDDLGFRIARYAESL